MIRLSRMPLAAGSVLLLALLACKGGSVEGTYNLDKTEIKKEMEAEIQKMSAEERGFAQLGVALIDLMEIKLELKSGGVAEISSKTPKLEEGQAEMEKDTGTWAKDGDTVTVTTKEDTLSCTAGDGKLRCKDKKGKPIVFNKA
jgi:hypothetical protein